MHQSDGILEQLARVVKGELDSLRQKLPQGARRRVVRQSEKKETSKFPRGKYMYTSGRATGQPRDARKVSGSSSFYVLQIYVPRYQKFCYLSEPETARLNKRV